MSRPLLAIALVCGIAGISAPAFADQDTDPAAVDAVLLDDWIALDAPRVIADGRFVSRPGVFAWDRIDAASATYGSAAERVYSAMRVELPLISWAM